MLGELCYNFAQLAERWLPWKLSPSHMLTGPWARIEKQPIVLPGKELERSFVACWSGVMKSARVVRGGRVLQEGGRGWSGGERRRLRKARWYGGGAGGEGGCSSGGVEVAIRKT